MLYSLTAVTKELLALRQPALTQLQAAASWASTACSKVKTAAVVSHDIREIWIALTALRTSDQVTCRAQACCCSMCSGNTPATMHRAFASPDNRRLRAVRHASSPHNLTVTLRGSSW